MLLRVGKNKDLFMVIRRDFILRVLNSEKKYVQVIADLFTKYEELDF